MNLIRLAAVAALACISFPANAWDYREQDQPYTFLFMRIPLDGRSTKEQIPVWGLAVRGKREYQVMRLDSQMMTRFTELGFVESKFLIVGAVAAAGAVAVAASGSKSAATQTAQQQVAAEAAATKQAATQQAAAQQAAARQQAGQTTTPCPVVPVCAK
jgi:hypothetical protein